jgi:hypothetical protein
MEQDQLLTAPMLMQTMELAVRRFSANQRYIDKPKPGMVQFNLVPVSPGESMCSCLIRPRLVLRFCLLRSQVGAPDGSGGSTGSCTVFSHAPVSCPPALSNTPPQPSQSDPLIGRVINGADGTVCATAVCHERRTLNTQVRARTDKNDPSAPKPAATATIDHRSLRHRSGRTPAPSWITTTANGILSLEGADQVPGPSIRSRLYPMSGAAWIGWIRAPIIHGNGRTNPTQNSQ